MSRRHEAVLALPLLVGCWSLKPADEVPDGGIDAAVDVPRGEAAATEVGGGDGPSDARGEGSLVDLDVPIDSARTDVIGDIVQVDAADAGLIERDVGPVDSGTLDVSPRYPADLRLIAPTSLATVSDAQPTLRWSGGVSDVRLRICRNRSCADVAYAAFVSGVEHTVSPALAPGVYFWNLQRSDTGRTITMTWQFRVPRADRRRAGPPAGVAHRDLDGDGFQDVAVSAFGSQMTPVAGVVHVFAGARAPSSTPRQTLTGPTGTAGSGYGRLLAWGDFNRDDLADLAIGVFDPIRNAQGRVEVMRSNGRTLSLAATITNAPIAPPVSFPSSMGTGDLNGDGYDDLAASTAGAIGQVQVHAGGPSGLSMTPTVVIANPSARPTGFGASTAVVGDVDGDGLGDLVVTDGCDPPSSPDAGVPSCQPSSRGRLHLFFGRESAVALGGVRVTVEGDLHGRLGRSLAPAGDLNQDGYADFLVTGTTGLEERTTGVVHVYLGRARSAWFEGARPVASLSATGQAEMLGGTVAAVDVNRDGRTDVLAGAPGRADRVASYQGAVVAWIANAPTTFGPALATLPPNTSGGLLGEVVSAVGDIDGDGAGDLLVTAPLSPSRASALGQVSFWASSASEFPVTPASLIVTGAMQGGWLGRGATR